MVRIRRWRRSGARRHVDDLALDQVVEQPVDGEIAAQSIFFGGAELVVLPDQRILVALGLLGMRRKVAVSMILGRRRCEPAESAAR